MAIELLEGFTIEGNYADGSREKAVLSMVEAEVRTILMNEDFLMLSRASATASQVSILGDAGIVLYRIPERLVYGTDWDKDSGATKQTPSVVSTRLVLDQYITIKYQLPKFDMRRFKEGTGAIRAQLAAQWAGSIVMNSLMNLECLFIEGVKNYLIARYDFDKESVLIADASKIKDQQSAEDYFYQIGEKMIKKIGTVTLQEIGTNKSDWTGRFSPIAYMNLTRVYTKLIGTQAAVTSLAQGNLSYDTILGTNIAEHMYIGKTFNQKDETRINKDTSYDLTGFDAFFIHNQAAAMPVVFDEFGSVIDNDTMEPKFMGRTMLSLVMMLRGHLGFLVMPAEPTAEQIAKAKALIYNVGDPNMTKRYQLTSWDIKLFNGEVTKPEPEPEPEPEGTE